MGNVRLVKMEQNQMIQKENVSKSRFIRTHVGLDTSDKMMAPAKPVHHINRFKMMRRAVDQKIVLLIKFLKLMVHVILVKLGHNKTLYRINV